MAAPPELQQVMQSTYHDRYEPVFLSQAGAPRVALAGNISSALKIFPGAGQRRSDSRAHLQRPRWHESCCVATVAQHSEADRIRLVVERDGLDAAVEWVRRTLQIYVQALDDPANFARVAEYRPRFEQSIREFEAWLDLQGRGSRANAAPHDSSRTSS